MRMSLLLLSRHKMNTTFSLFGGLTIGSATINNIVGLPLNAYVMWLILTGARETLTSDFLSLNLALSEIFFALSTAWLFAFDQLNLGLCFEAFMFSRGLLLTARPLFQCCICVECYFGVVHPVLFLQFKQLRHKVASCCVVWLIALVSCIYCLYTYSNSLYLYGFFVQNILILFIMLFCCLSVLSALKRPGPGEKITKKKKKEKKSNAVKRRAFKIILLIMISMTINFFFYVAPIPMQCCLSSLEFMNVLTICTGIALTTGFIQPLLYLHRTGHLPCFRTFWLSLSQCLCMCMYFHCDVLWWFEVK